MAQLTGEGLILVLAVLLIGAGVAGLAPTALRFLRRKRLLAQLANLKVNEDAARNLFAGIMPRPPGEGADGAATPAARHVIRLESSQPPIAAELAAVRTAAAAAARAGAGSNAKPDTDAILALRGERARSATPSPSSGAGEGASPPSSTESAVAAIAALDLLAEARALRELLRRP